MVPSFEDVFEPTKKNLSPKNYDWRHQATQVFLGCLVVDFWGQVRCGGTIYEGQFWQLPQHASRAKILEWLQPTWRGQTWAGWPGEVQGCGRPFRFPKDLSVELRNEGCLGTVHVVFGNFWLFPRDPPQNPQKWEEAEAKGRILDSHFVFF